MNNLETIKQQIHQILQDNLNDATPQQLSGNTELFALGLNSLNAVSLVLGLEDTFGFEFDLDEISFDSFRVVSDIVDLVTRKLGVSR
ncbi:MAG: phosphopantetheine-binding protein [Geitlerinemataceae cyanobacterium]